MMFSLLDTNFGTNHAKLKNWTLHLSRNRKCCSMKYGRLRDAEPRGKAPNLHPAVEMSSENYYFLNLINACKLKKFIIELRNFLNSIKVTFIWCNSTFRMLKIRWVINVWKPFVSSAPTYTRLASKHFFPMVKILSSFYNELPFIKHSAFMIGFH